MKNKTDIFSKNNTTEAEFLAIIEKFINVVAPKYIFGYHSKEDIVQFAHLKGLEALHSGKYDVSRPLNSFLFIHITNRLKNLLRDEKYRYESPCKACPLFDKNFEVSDNQCKKHKDRFDCEEYREWRQRNDRKSNIMSPLNYEDMEPHEGCNGDKDPIINEIGRRELIEKIDRELSTSLRGDFLKILAGIRINPKRKAIVQAAIREIIVGSGQYPELNSYFGEPNE